MCTGGVKVWSGQSRRAKLWFPGEIIPAWLHLSMILIVQLPNIVDGHLIAFESPTHCCQCLFMSTPQPLTINNQKSHARAMGFTQVCLHEISHLRRAQTTWWFFLGLYSALCFVYDMFVSNYKRQLYLRLHKGRPKALEKDREIVRSDSAVSIVPQATKAFQRRRPVHSLWSLCSFEPQSKSN